MRIFNKNKTEELQTYDAKKGALVQDRLFVAHHEAVEGDEGVWHYETVAEYENGGKDVEKVWDSEPTPAQAAYDEYEDILVYVEYSDEELASREIEELKARLAATDYQAIKYAEGVLSADKYEPVKAERQAWRDRINQLEMLLTK